MKIIKEPCKEIFFREIYGIDGNEVIYYSWERSRIMAFFHVIKRLLIFLVIAFRLLMRIEPKLN